MRPVVKLCLAAAFLWLALATRPPEAEALCVNDTYCGFYTDDTFSTLCGEREVCINCTTANYQWGCTGSPYRWCQTYGNCGGNAGCIQCYVWGCMTTSCGPGPNR